MENNEIFSEDSLSLDGFRLRSSNYKIIPGLIVLILTSLLGTQALLVVPSIISNRPKPPSPDIDPFLYDHYIRVYEMEQSLYQLQLAYFWGPIAIWIFGVIVFVWIVIRLSASVSISERGIILSKKFDLIKLNRSWQTLTSIYIEVTRGRRSDKNLRLIISTHIRTHQIKLSYLELKKIMIFTKELGVYVKHYSSLIFQASKSTTTLLPGVERLSWVWEAETEVFR
ncbi:MAG: hypothetical protein ACFE9L_14145 [Candidatus Hodarchaeota archaeon]